MELVATSRVEDLSCLAIGNKPASELSRQVLLKIGTTEAYATRKAYLEDIRVRAATSKTLIEERIAAVDPNPNANANAEDRTYQGGCEFLLDWYNDLTSNNENL